MEISFDKTIRTKNMLQLTLFEIIEENDYLCVTLLNVAPSIKIK